MDTADVHAGRRQQAVKDFLDEDELELARTTAVQARSLSSQASPLALAVRINSSLPSGDS